MLKKVILAFTASAFLGLFMPAFAQDNADSAKPTPAEMQAKKEEMYKQRREKMEAAHQEKMNMMKKHCEEKAALMDKQFKERMDQMEKAHDAKMKSMEQKS